MHITQKIPQETAHGAAYTKGENYFGSIHGVKSLFSTACCNFIPVLVDNKDLTMWNK